MHPVEEHCTTVFIKHVKRLIPDTQTISSSINK